MSDVSSQGASAFRLSAKGAPWRVLMFQGELHVVQVDSGEVTCTAWQVGANDTQHTRRWTFLGNDVLDIAVSQGGRLVAALGAKQVVVGRLSGHKVEAWPTLELPGRADIVAVSEVSFRGSVLQAEVLVADTTAGKSWLCSLSATGQQSAWRDLGNAVLDVVGARSGTFVRVSPAGDLFDEGQPPMANAPGKCDQIDFRRGPDGDTCVLRGHYNDGAWLRVLHRSATGNALTDVDYAFDSVGWGRVRLGRGTSRWTPLIVEDLLADAPMITLVEPEQLAPPPEPAHRTRRDPQPFLDNYRFHVFISYSRGGRSQEIAEEVYRMCTQRGLSVWWDLAQDVDGEAPILMRENYMRDAQVGLKGSLSLLCVWGERTVEARANPEMNLSQQEELYRWEDLAEMYPERLRFRIVTDQQQPPADDWAQTHKVQNFVDDGSLGHVVRDLVDAIEKKTSEVIASRKQHYAKTRAGSFGRPTTLEVLD